MGILFFLVLSAAILAGFLFPYGAMLANQYSLLVLAFLVFLSSVIVNWDSLLLRRIRWKPIGVGLFISYVFVPGLVWFLAEEFIPNPQLRLGLVLTSLAPVAAVAPYFVTLAGGDAEASFLLVLISTALFPAYSSLMLGFLFNESPEIAWAPTIKTSLLTVSIPCIVGLIVQKYIALVRRFTSRLWGPLNLICLAFLMFSVFGSAINKVGPMSRDFPLLGFLGICALQDIGIFFLLRWALPAVLTRGDALTLAVSSSLKNAAATGVLLLMYRPASAIASAAVLISHLLLFSVLHLPYFRRAQD